MAPGRAPRRAWRAAACMSQCVRGCQPGDAMKITEVKTFLVNAAHPESGTEGVTSRHWDSRNWLFIKIITDSGVYGVGEASGWPRVVETAIQDLTPLLIGEDPLLIERLWHKMMVSMMGHGMLGVVGHGALTGIEMALWDVKGKALGVPVWQLLGGKMRDRIHCYAHSSTVEGARDLVNRGYDAIKIGGGQNCLQNVHAIREEVGDEVDLMVDVHGPPWLTPRDAIALGKQLEPYHLLFFEDPVAPENIDALGKVARNVSMPIAAGERHAGIHGVRQLIEQEIIDVVQPDTGRAGGLWQMLKLCHMAEAHHIMVAPHSGSLGPVAEMATVHLMACLPNFLILEHLDGDVPQRYLRVRLKIIRNFKTMHD